MDKAENIGPTVVKMMNNATAELVLKETKNILGELGIVFFLRHGTCLGAIRDGKLISWDDDLDVGSIIGLNGLDEKAIYHGTNAFKNNGFRATVSETDFYISVELEKSGIPLDWTCYRILDDSIFQYPAVRIPVELHYSLKEINFLGEQFLVPSPPEKYLELKYGPDWMTPKKTGFEHDIIKAIPDNTITRHSNRLVNLFKVISMTNYNCRIKVVDSNAEPILGASVVVVGIQSKRTNKSGYAKFNLPSKNYYAVVIEYGDHKEVLYQEILEPKVTYIYTPDSALKAGRIYALTEQ